MEKETTTHWTRAKTFPGILIAVVVIGGLVFLVFAPPRDSPPPHESGAPASAPAGAAPAGEEQPAKPTDTDHPPPPTSTERQTERERMVEVIQSYGLRDAAVLDAMRAVPRHEFVPDDMQSHAYGDSPLPIGYGQTISQPYIVAEMTRQLGLKKDSKVLEVGTGSGYQAAVLRRFTPRVFTIEIIKPLAESAAKRLARLKYEGIQVRTGDGYYGWPEEAPFDAIIVTCAAGQIPPPLLKQLAAGGRMVIPVGPSYAVQSLLLVEKKADGNVRTSNLMAVRFVPLIWKDESAE